MLAVKYGSTEAIELLLDRGADLNIHNKYDLTAFGQAIRGGNMETVKLLLEHQPNLIIKYDEGWDEEQTALMIAAVKGHTEIVRLLLDRGADPNIQDDQGQTALINAIFSISIETVKLLLDRGADPNIQDDQGQTALMFTARNGHTEIMELLILAGADPGIKNDQDKTAADILKDWHPEKYDQWRQSTLVKARKKTLKCEDSVNSGRNVPDFDI